MYREHVFLARITKAFSHVAKWLAENTDVAHVFAYIGLLSQLPVDVHICCFSVSIAHVQCASMRIRREVQVCREADICV